LTQYTKAVKNIPNHHNITIDYKIYQMAIKCSKWSLNIHTIIFHSKALQKN
jgi:hypothetical protein